ncbi:MAG: hypothetical protein MUP98_12215 [Candidatus Aminicenantes bacterium]|nr:hypothetical protein [Candidatus Aminicenantes bacterium]
MRNLEQSQKGNPYLFVTVWFWVYFAAILSVLGVAAVIMIWRLRKKAGRGRGNN